jgi:predicted deacylase
MTQNHLAQYNVEELQGYFSDFHKDFFGFRPRYATPEQWRSREYLEAAINAIHNTMDKMKQTFNGREELRAAGWVVDEADYADIIDPEEYARWSADADAQAYGEMA